MLPGGSRTSGWIGSDARLRPDTSGSGLSDIIQSHTVRADNYSDLAPRRCALTLAFLRGLQRSLASIGHIDLLRKGNDRLPAHPPHGVRVLVPNHRSNLGVCEDRRSRNRPLEAASPLHWRFLRTGLVP